MNAKTTYYIKLQSCTNAACETQVFESPSPLLSEALVEKVQGFAKSWGAGNGSRFVEVSAETYAGGCAVSQHVVEVPQPKQPVLRSTLNLDSSVKFHAVLEALQQYIDNCHDAEYLIDDARLDEFQAKVEAAEGLRDQLDAVLASLADA